MGEVPIAESDLPFGAPGQARFPGISSRAYEHPADRTGLVALRKLPGLDTAVKKFQSMFSERAIRMHYLATAVRTSDRQFARMHRLLHEAADVLDLERVPELYVRLSPEVNASAVGMNEPFIVLTTALVDLMSPEELRFVIGHELGHAMSGHSLYQTIALYLTALGGMAASVPLGGIGLQAIQAALGEWMRKAELSSDRAGLLVTQDRDTCLRALMKLAGGAHLGEMNTEEFLVQAAEYGQVGDVRDNIIRYALTHDLSHPLPVVRVAELNRWALGPAYTALLAGVYPLRGDDANASVSQEARESVAFYQERIKESSDPLLANIKGFRSSMQGKGQRMIGPMRQRIADSRRPALEQSDGSPPDPPGQPGDDTPLQLPESG